MYALANALPAECQYLEVLVKCPEEPHPAAALWLVAASVVTPCHCSTQCPTTPVSSAANLESAVVVCQEHLGCKPKYSFGEV